jgi:hypothetical protein
MGGREVSIADNITARQDAEEIIAFIGDKPQRFWEVLAAHAATNLPPDPGEPAIEPMDDVEATRFEKYPFTWGKHIGEEVGSVPVSYLLFLAEGDEFTKRLRRYVASKVFAQRQDEEDVK